MKPAISPALRQACPGIRLHLYLFEVTIQPSGADIQAFLEHSTAAIATRLGNNEAIAQVPPLRATREAYKACGKDPSRYRPSAEALLRRIVSGKGLYSVSNAVDLLNLVSAETGFSIGGWDAAYIQGAMEAGIGGDEPYVAIGRGELNIAGLPVMRDSLGPFGTPTSDSERTCVRPETQQLLACFYDFGGGDAIAAGACMTAYYARFQVGNLLQTITAD